MGQFLAALLEKAQANLKILLVAPPPMEPGAWVSNHRTLEGSRRLAGCYKRVAHQLGIAFADAGTWGVGLTYVRVVIWLLPKEFGQRWEPCSNKQMVIYKVVSGGI